MKRIIVIVMVFGVALVAGGANATAEEPVRLDARADKSKDTIYYLQFCSQDSFPGHAWVIWQRKLPSDSSPVPQQAWGFYTKRDAGGVTSTANKWVEGDLRSDSEREKKKGPSTAQSLLQLMKAHTRKP